MMTMTNEKLVTFVKLNNHNYDPWSFKMRIIMMKEKCWDVISKGKPNPLTADWEDKNNRALYFITTHVEDAQFVHFRDCADAIDAWNCLKDYHQKTSLSEKIRVMQRLFRTVLEVGGNAEEHLQNMLEWFDKLNQLGHNFDEDTKVGIILASLNDEYNTLISALEAREKLKFKEVNAKILEEFERMRKQKDDSAFKVIKAYDGENSKQSWCNFCKKNGHTVKNCFKKKNLKKNEVKRMESAKVVMQSNSNGVEELSDVAFTAVNMFATGWIIDSGASSHICNDFNAFVEINTSVQHEVLVANNDRIKASGCGVVRISVLANNKVTAIEVKDVLYIPQISSNLLSVPKLIDKGLTVLFEKKCCKIQFNGELMAQANLSDGVYKLVESDSVYFVANAELCIHEWHRRLAHRDINVIKKMLAEDFKVKKCKCDDICEVCLLGKMTRKPYPKESKTKSTEVLDLVLTDVVGPMQVTSIGGCRYFVTFIDHYSRYTEVYFLKQKSDVASKLIEYVEMCKTKFNRKPKILRSDNGTEYTGSAVEQYLILNGIKHQLSVPYCPQQNGLAERKTRYLVEATRCLLIDSGLAKRFWAEAVNTSNYLQNRIVTRSTGKTPYELWHGLKPDLNNMYVFGSQAFAKIPDNSRKKLNEKAEKVIFVGYSEVIKGYKFFNEGKNRMFYSRDYKVIDQKQRAVRSSNKILSNNSICPCVGDVGKTPTYSSNKTTESCLINIEEYVPYDNANIIDSESEYYEADENLPIEII
jgi:transposase InsO family protein